MNNERKTAIDVAEQIHAAHLASAHLELRHCPGPPTCRFVDVATPIIQAALLEERQRAAQIAHAHAEPYRKHLRANAASAIAIGDQIAAASEDQPAP